MRLLVVAYLSSYSLSLLGNSIAGIAVPLIVLQVTGNPLSLGIVAVSTAVPAVVAGLLMGVVIDRINRRASSVITDLISATAIGALPIIDMVTGLNLGWFILFGIIGSLGDVPGMTAREALLPAIVRHSGVTAERMVGIREGLGALAIVVGPAAAGGLMVLFSGSTVLWITAATSFTAALITLIIPHDVGQIVPDPSTHENAAVANSTVWEQLKDGWTVLFRTSRFLLAVTMINLVLVITLGALQGAILPVHFTAIGEPDRYGFVLSSLALGTLVGGGIYAATGTRGRRRAWFLIGLAGTVAGFAIIALLPSTWLVFTGAFIVGLSCALFGMLIGVLEIERIPEHMRGRITSTQNAILTAAAPAGIFVASIITQYGSVGLAGIVFAVIWAGAALVAAFLPALRNLESVNVQPAEAR